MTIKVAITGFGRIGRNVLRAHYELGKKHDIEIVAINAMGDIKTNAHLLRHDTVHGHFNHEVKVEEVSDTEKYLIVDGDRMRVFCDRDPRNLPWKELGVDVVLECTGAFRTKEKCLAHLEGGAKKVLISAPGKGVDATVVYGVNQDVLTKDMTVVSNASCTTNCLARRARSATHSMIPTKTGAAAAVGLVLPDLNGKLDGFAVRVPTINVSFVDLTFEAKRDVTVEEINAVMKAASELPENQGILGYNDEPLVSIDFNHDAHSSIFDATLTKVSGTRLVKVTAWYDNEWGFSCRMLDTACAMMAAQ